MAWWRLNVTGIKYEATSTGLRLSTRCYWKHFFRIVSSSSFLNTRFFNGHVFIVRNCSFFMGIIFCSSVALVSTFDTRGVYNFITKEANIPVNLVPLFNNVSFLFYRFLKFGVTNEPKSLFLSESKKVWVIYSKESKILLLIKR